MSVQFPFSNFSPSPLLSPVPPWVDLENFLTPQFAECPTNLLSPIQCRNIFANLINLKYNSYTHIYTDGSVLTGAEQSTSAGVVAHEAGYYMRRSYHLPAAMSIFSAELFAIYEALKYIHDKHMGMSPGAVIFTDSQSGIYAIQNSVKPCHTHYIYNIQSLLSSLQSRFPVIIQYIPSHRGIAGNELADHVAKIGHDIEEITEAPLPKQDKVHLAWTKINTLWQSYWSDVRDLSGKGKHLFHIKSTMSEWS